VAALPGRSCGALFPPCRRGASCELFHQSFRQILARILPTLAPDSLEKSRRQVSMHGDAAHIRLIARRQVLSYPPRRRWQNAARAQQWRRLDADAAKTIQVDDRHKMTLDIARVRHGTGPPPGSRFLSGRCELPNRSRALQLGRPEYRQDQRLSLAVNDIAPAPQQGQLIATRMCCF